MILEGCQGKPRTPEILEKVCPQCGSEIELFTCDTQAASRPAPAMRTIPP